MNNRLIKSNDAGGGACTNTVDLYNPFPDGGGVALYQLNGDATDVSGNYDGTATNVTYGTGQFGQAGVFNGSSSKIDLPNLGLGGSATRTISAWINVNSLSSAQTIFQYGANSNGQRFGFAIDTSGKVYVEYYNRDAITSSAQITVGTWFHIATTYNGGAIEIPENTQIYINGSAVAMATVGAQTGFPNTANSNYGVGYDRLNTRQYFNGSIDQVRIFSRALRPYEVEALYTEEYCTPTIVPSEHFNTVTYTGNGTTLPITGVGFQPDLVWIKGRTLGSNHQLTDVVRTAPNSLMTNRTDAEASRGVSSFDSDGFTLQVWPNENGDSNTSGDNYVAWNFKAGGAAVTNTDGTITSQVSANTEAGFSIVSYTTQSSGTATVGHGLNTEPNIVLVKTRGVADSWRMYHSSLGSGSQIYLNLTNAAGSTVNQWNNTAPTSSVFSLGTDNAGSYTTIAYCFAEVEGFSNFGSYAGTGAASGNVVVTGFEPAMVIIKRSSNFSDWSIFDNKRATSNVVDLVLAPNLSDAERSYGPVTFLENGFELTNTKGGLNSSGDTFIYMAFAADPTAVEPSLEDSFNTVLYTANGGVLPVTGVGFQPDLVWIKQRTSTGNNSLFDSIRGVEKYLISNSTIQETDFSGVNGLTSFDSDGFTVDDTGGLDYSVNHAGNYVAWNWKGAEIPAINSNGSIPSVVSANPAAGFSIVSYTGNGVVSTVGHGLSEAPKVIIAKNRNDGAEVWAVYHSDRGKDKVLVLNSANAEESISNYWGTNGVNDTVFGITSSAYESINQNGSGFIAYCFAEVAGFSKFGSYTGTGSAGNAQTLGFEPAFVMAKRTDAASGWLIVDNKRNGTANYELFAHSSDAEYAYDRFLFNSNGFEFNSSAFNESGSTWIYMAFANQF